jgi:hypothetical protein
MGMAGILWPACEATLAAEDILCPPPAHCLAAAFGEHLPKI